ncbi:hypothetical protein BH20ACI1_BH20ACI1_04580 [soil metagenome]
MKIRFFGHCRLPSKIAARFAFSDAPKKIAVPDFTFVRFFSKRLPIYFYHRRNSIFCNSPNGLHCRIITEIGFAFTVRKNLQFDIEPFARRRGFKFKVSVRIFKIGRDKNFKNIPLLQNSCFFSRVRVRINNQRFCLIFLELDIKSRFAPDKTCLCAPFDFNNFTRPIKIQIYFNGILSNRIVKIINPEIAFCI